MGLLGKMGCARGTLIKILVWGGDGSGAHGKMIVRREDLRVKTDQG